MEWKRLKTQVSKDLLKWNMVGGMFWKKKATSSFMFQKKKYVLQK